MFTKKCVTYKNVPAYDSIQGFRRAYLCQPLCYVFVENVITRSDPGANTSVHATKHGAIKSELLCLGVNNTKRVIFIYRHVTVVERRPQIDSSTLRCSRPISDECRTASPALKQNEAVAILLSAPTHRNPDSIIVNYCFLCCIIYYCCARRRCPDFPIVHLAVRRCVLCLPSRSSTLSTLLYDIIPVFQM